MKTDMVDYIEYYERDPNDMAVEDVHQVNSYAWITYHYPQFLTFHPVNEGKKHMHSALRDEQAGLLKGVSDFIILIGAGNRYPFAAIELKRTNKSGKGKATPVSSEQRKFLRGVRERGGFAAVAYGFKQFKEAVTDMAKGNSTNC